MGITITTAFDQVLPIKCSGPLLYLWCYPLPGFQQTVRIPQGE
jgi:hypothetical protein